ncbi:FAD/NAD(P)-binding domain-containing protein [Aspergillus californicus]
MSDVRGPRPDDYPYLSLPIDQMKPEYDVVVVGSGYGAGVAASRMARGGKRVAVLELGWERRAGSFPHTLTQCLRDFNISGSTGRYPVLGRSPLRAGDAGATKLFQLKLGDGQHAFCAHGLGGGSLINAGVFLEATEETMKMSAWPSEIRDNPTAMMEYYDRASTMLQPTLYPKSHPQLPKLSHLQEAAGTRGQQSNFSRVPLTTFFHEGRNRTGVNMQPNQGTGHESTGSNDGSKNSVPVTYLADAWNWGAEIFCGCQVRYVEKETTGEGYIVHFSWHAKGRGTFDEGFRTQLFWVKAKEFCFLGAGALGTTEILLRSRQYGLPLSPMLGRNMSGNGDLLVFGYNGSKDINGIAGDSKTNPGPTITCMVDNRKSGSENPLPGYIIQDGCIPKPLAPILQGILMLQMTGKDVLSLFRNPRLQTRRFVAALKSLIWGPYTPGGAIQRTSTYLIMSHDSNEATLTLLNDVPYLQAGAEGRSKNITRIKDTLAHIIKRTGASMGFGYFYGKHQEETSVHVLGGANMSRNGTGHEGVTNHLGQLYTGHGNEVHRGLVCCDASVIPTSLGVNPLAAITALAERSVALLAEQSGVSVDLETRNGSLDVDSRPRVSHLPDHRSDRSHNKFKDEYGSTGWQFTESLEGYVGVPSNVSDFHVSEEEGKGSSSAMKMVLTVEIQRRTHGTNAPRYQGVCTGTVSCRALSRRTIIVMRGQVDFFVGAEDSTDSTKLIYTLPLRTVEGMEYTLVGYKTIDCSASFSVSRLWGATTVLHVLVKDSTHQRIGTGVLRIPFSSFRCQIRTFRTMEHFTISALLPLLFFLLYFLLQISLFFFHPLIPFRFGQSAPAGIHEKQKPSNAIELQTSDGVKIKLEAYGPVKTPEASPATTSKNPILFLPGITGLNPKHSIFALPYQRCNMVEYFTSRGHRCYLLTPRWSYEENYAKNVAKECTVYDARLDVAAAIQHILTEENQTPYIIAHCQGSVALALGLLDGTINALNILGITANSVFMNQVFAYWNSIKASGPFLVRGYEVLGGNYFPISFLENKKGVGQRALDAVLSFYPISRRRDFCTSSACHRTSFAFGLLWNHRNISRAIHDNIDTFFARTPTKVMEYIVRVGSRGGCMDNDLRPLLTRDNLQRLRGVPILFISGAENEVFNPETTLRDYELLRRDFGEDMYRRFLVEGYGHLDPIVGKDADRDVYWRVFEHLKWCTEHQTTVNGCKPTK